MNTPKLKTPLTCVVQLNPLALLHHNFRKILVLILVQIIVIVFPTFQNLGNADPSRLSDAQERQVEKIVHDYLLNNPELLLEVMERLEQNQKADAAKKNSAQIAANKEQLFNYHQDYVVNQEGKIPLVEFFDYQCSYCKRVLPTIVRVAKTLPNVRLIFKELPILGEISTLAARAALASKRQGKYFEFHSALMKHKDRLTEEKIMSLAEKVGLQTKTLRDDMLAPDINDAIKVNRKLADTLGIRGTPTLIVGNKLVTGAVGYDRISELVKTLN